VSVLVSAFLAVSLDGFIATSEGSVAWLDEANAAVPEGEDFGYERFIGSVDTIVVGKNTFQQVLGFGVWPYTNKRVIVLSRTGTGLPNPLPHGATVVAEEPQALLYRLEGENAKHVYVDGGITVQRFLRTKCLNSITLTQIPVLLGAGIPLFGALQAKIQLKLISTNSHTCGYVQTKYSVLY
jgi:dihydrofolate reductase